MYAALGVILGKPRVVITHPLGIVSSYDGLADRVVGAGSSEAFSVDDGAQGGVGLS